MLETFIGRYLRWNIARLLFWIAILSFPAQTVHATTWYVTLTRTADYVYASGVTDTNYAMGGIHVAYATANITSPTGRYVSYSTSAPTRITADNSMLIYKDDGTYTGGNAAAEYCPVGFMMWYYSVAQGYLPITPFVRLSAASFAPNQIMYQSSSTTLRATAETSNSCSGTVVVAYTLTKQPSGIQIGPASDEDDQTMAGAQTKEFTWQLATTVNNPYAGTVTAHVYVSGRPPTCEIKQGGGDLYPTLTLVH